MDKAYVSDFTRFMNRYLEQHPEVVEDQQRGWRLGWVPKIDPQAWREAAPDFVEDDTYGFNWFTWRTHTH